MTELMKSSSNSTISSISHSFNPIPSAKPYYFNYSVHFITHLSLTVYLYYTMHSFKFLAPLILATLASGLAITPNSAALEARQGKTWNIMTGSEDCGADTANACILRGGDPTVVEDKSPRFSNGNVCQGQTASFQSRHPHPDAGSVANPHCVITARIDDSCKINGKSGAQEIGLSRNTEKTTPIGTPETVGDVEFSGSCGAGTYIGSEIRLV
ncbi:hypothetical protein CkaCkLH20_04238 [Colletotrichum karsti]|uniref:Uncharacterized protein n=1 Tax=Colletotrichum karsti TaxID=1095194 RepID=A0A9P6IG82_9PEZI|nr:uncharacterized protein CkaCkLH20_04238 [Colletotrichum karsti]KAF9878200.1 hypothetical protein CkaCkLH20_04238 [Colletotrichum karsti]